MKMKPAPELHDSIRKWLGRALLFCACVLLAAIVWTAAEGLRMGRLPPPTLRNPGTGELQGCILLLTAGIVGLLVTPVIRLAGAWYADPQGETGKWSLRVLGVLLVSVAFGLILRR